MDLGKFVVMYTGLADLDELRLALEQLPEDTLVRGESLGIPDFEASYHCYRDTPKVSLYRHTTGVGRVASIGGVNVPPAATGVLYQMPKDSSPRFGEVHFTYKGTQYRVILHSYHPHQEEGKISWVPTEPKKETQ